jgi:YD repeat-containing protein
MEKKPKTITITQFDYIIRNSMDDELDSNGHPHHFSEFDSEGRPLKEIRYNRLGEFEEMYEYGYDAGGNLVRESYYPVENELAEEKTFERNEAGKVVRALKHYQDGSVDTITFEYDGADQLIRQTTTNDEGEIDQVETYEWENGVIVNHEVVDGEGELIRVPDENLVKPNDSRVIQNEKGQVVTEEELDEEGEVYMTVNRSYDAEDRADEVDVYFDGRGKAISRHYLLKYEYTFFE